uniref:Uncharacterized protein n=1 Tax=Solanum lycopersicum TaxID=4081 RepID=A0A3Q7FAM4_SOLLC
MASSDDSCGDDGYEILIRMYVAAGSLTLLSSLFVRMLLNCLCVFVCLECSLLLFCLSRSKFVRVVYLAGVVAEASLHLNHL